MIVSDKSLVILLTATIYPNSFDTLSLTNPVLRREQYIDALMFYILNTDFNIVFVENSGESLEPYFLKYNYRIEFLTYLSLPCIPDRGKGFKELEIIDYAIDNSKFIKRSKNIVKVTGRLKILNMSTLSKSFLKINRKHNRIVSCNTYGNKKMDSRCFFFSLDFWEYLKRRGQSINLKYSFENALMDSTLEYTASNKGVFKQLSSPLRISGMSGGFGTNYDSNYLKFFVKKLRHIMLKAHVYNKFHKNRA